MNLFAEKVSGDKPSANLHLFSVWLSLSATDLAALDNVEIVAEGAFANDQLSGTHSLQSRQRLPSASVHVSWIGGNRA